VAPEGRVLVRADFNQLELRIAAELSGDEQLIAAYREGRDVHALTAEAVLGVKLNELVAEERSQARTKAKAIAFGFLYGMGAATFREYALSSYGTLFSQEEAQAFRSRFLETYPGIAAWQMSQGNSSGDVWTRGGRRRLFAGNGREYCRRLNTPVQGLGADGLKRALALLFQTRHEVPSAAPVLVIHDEIVLEAPREQA
jgi:DNA polymerase-1